MNSVRGLSLFFLLCTLSNCTLHKKMEGLWLIEKVKIGDQEMTPVAKWTRLNKDHSQESGNGWFQHSIGTWDLNSKRKKIKINNTNGFEDEFGGFSVGFKNGKMLWKREEEGQTVELSLKKINKIPQAPSNKLLGVWLLLSKDGKEVKDSKSYIFIRWDQIIINREQEQDRRFGTYKTHGHKKELQIIYYGEPLQQETWDYEFSKTGDLHLSKKENDSKILLEYTRIGYIPK